MTQSEGAIPSDGAADIDEHDRKCHIVWEKVQSHGDLCGDVTRRERTFILLLLLCVALELLPPGYEISFRGGGWRGRLCLR